MVLQLVPLPTAGAAVLLLLSLYTIIKFLLTTLRPSHFPPGPRALPLLGNLHLLPPDKFFLLFTTLHSTYGDILGLKFGRRNVVVLNTPEMAFDLMSRRSERYSGRVPNYYLQEIIMKPGDEHWMTMPEGAKLRQWRSVGRWAVTRESTKMVAPVVSAAGSELIYRLLHLDADAETRTEQEKHRKWEAGQAGEKRDEWSFQTEEFYHWEGPFIKYLRNWAFETPYLLIVGRRIKGMGQDYVDSFCDGMHEMFDLIKPGSAPPVDIFPFLKYLPFVMTKWLRKGRKAREYFYWSANTLVEAARHGNEGMRLKNRKGGDVRMESVVGRILRDPEWKGEWPGNDVAIMVEGLMGAAVEGMVHMVRGVVQLLLAHPEVMREAQRELDEVCPDRCPRAEDMERLKYVKACCLEASRLRPLIPLGLPHTSTRDDWYDGYFIPAGTVIMPNLYSWGQNGVDFADPETFDPRRFLENPLGVRPERYEQLKDDPSRRPDYLFGWGRRTCPGEHFAMMTFEVGVAKLFWAFDFTARGKVDWSNETGYVDGFQYKPSPFDFDMNIRSKTKAELVDMEYRKDDAFLNEVLGW